LDKAAKRKAKEDKAALMARNKARNEAAAGGNAKPAAKPAAKPGAKPAGVSKPGDVRRQKSVAVPVNKQAAAQAKGATAASKGEPAEKGPPFEAKFRPTSTMQVGQDDPEISAAFKGNKNGAFRYEFVQGGFDTVEARDAWLVQIKAKFKEAKKAAESDEKKVRFWAPRSLPVPTSHLSPLTSHLSPLTSHLSPLCFPLPACHAPQR